jgi:alpha-tubulin suppressor-like RCC1 family protein
VVSGTIQPYTFMKNVQTIYGASSSEQLGWSDNEGGGTICFNKDGTKLALSSFNAQKVYVYTLTNGTYVLDSGTPLTNSNHFFGYACSLNDDGTLLAVNHFGGSNQQTGDTYVYQYSSGSWSLRATFGGGLYYTKASVLDGVGNRVLASASGTNTMKIYDWNGSTYAESQSFSGSSEFANGMDMTRDGLIVGGINKTTNNTVKVWQYSGSSWSQMGSDVSVGNVSSFFRLNRVGGTRFIVSSPYDDTAFTDAGIVKVYDYAGGSWTNTKTFYGDSASSGLGTSINISDDGKVIISGGSTDDTKSTDAGVFYEFKETNGVWETKKFYDNVAGARFGSGIAMNSTANVYAIGAGYDDTIANNAGKVVIYKPENVFSFDGYNKLSINGVTPTSTTLTDPSGNTYDLTTQTDVYIKDTGTYEAAITVSDKFALVSNTVTTVNSITEKIPLVSWTNLGTSLTSDDGVHTFTSDGSNYSQVSGSTDNYITNTGNERLYIDLESLRSREKAFTFEYEIYGPQWKFGAQFGNLLGTISSSHEADSIGFHFGAAHSTDLGLHSPNVNLVYTTGENENDFGTSRWVKIRWTREANSNTIKLYIDDVYKNQITADSSSPNNTSYTDYGIKSHITLFRHDWNSTTNQYAASGTRIRNIKLWDTVDIKIPKLTHDTYNKLSIENITPTASTLRLGSNTYDIGTATDIYIEDTGTYEIETKDANTFAFASNTATYQVHPNTAYSNYRSIGGISAASTSLHNENITTTYSVTMWAKKINGQYFFRTANSDTSSNPNNTHGILRWQSSKISHVTWTSNNGLGITYNTTLDATSKDEWHFYGFEFEGTTTKLHLDGAAPITGTTGLLGQTHNRIRFDDPTIFSTGSARLAEFAVYNRALSDAEFVSIYNNGLPNGPDNVSSGRVSWFKCLSGAMGTNSGTGGDFDASFTEDTDVPSAWLDPTPSLTHDTYNKLSIENITPTASTLRLGSNTYDIGTATDIYIEDTGTYDIEAKSANAFVFASNVVSSVTRVEPVITGGYQFGHALTYDGKLYGWGENSNGELGVGDITDKTVPTLCTGIPQGEIVSIWNQSIRGQSRWAKTRDGRIWVTGDHDSYCLPGSSSDFTTFTDVSVEFGDYTQTSNNVVWASGSERATQVLMENGDVWSFGDDTGSLGVLGQGASPTSDRTPRKLNVSNITKITYGGDLVLALDSSNVIWMWGRNSTGNSTLGWGPYNVPTNIMSTGTNSLTSLLATDSETVVDIESSYYSMFALTDKGTVYCTGHNASGQLGQGNATAKTSSDGWVKIEYFTSNAITVNKLYVGGGNPHVFADTSDGWYCWGENTTGELGLGDTTDKLSPVKFTGVSNIKKFGVGYLVSYAITEDGKYYAWGRGTNYARGDNTTGDITYPKHIDTLPNILAPSFEFDGYDKVFVNYPEVYKYDFYINVLSDDNLVFHEINFKDSTGASIKPLSYDKYNEIPVASWATGDMSGLFDGSTTAPPDFGFYKSDSSVGDKMFYVILPKLASSVVISHARPKYTPGFKIKVGTSVVFSEDSNGGTGETPAPYSKTCTLSTNVSKSQYTKYTKDTHTYDTNQAQIVTISEPGTYDAQIKSDTDFSLKSTTIPETKASGLYTWAFHHGNFDNAYGDGDILTARDNGRFYADTPSYTGDIGTITGSKGVPGASTQYPTGGWLTSSTSTQYPSINNNGFITQFTNYYNGMNSDNYKILDNNDTTSTYAPSDQGCAFSYYNNSEKVYIEKVYVDFGTGQPESETIFLLEYANDVSTVTSSTSINSRDSSILKVINSRNVWEITVNKALWKFHIDCYNNGNNKMGCSPYSMYWTAYTLGEDDGTIYTFTPASALTANVLMVAGGGGGGGRYNCGGGGAGGLVYTVGTTLSGTKTIVVGNGDSGGNGGAQSGYNGKDTTFTGLTTAVGGGYGGTQGTAGGTGGSGGGGGGQTGNGPGGSATSGQGFAGGTGSNSGSTFGGGGGGGGAGDVGGNGSDGVGGNGGIGKFFGTGSSYTDFGDEYGEGGYFASGAGGGSKGSTAGGIPGRGGGGYGARYYGYMGIGGSQHALPHTGGGGGGGSTPDRDQHPGYASNGDGGVTAHGGRGGSGIVLIQTNVALPNGSNTAVVQVGNPRRRSLPPTVDYMGSEVNRFYIIDSASMPTYKLPTHWYVDPIGSNSNSLYSTQGSHSLQKRADGGTSSVWYATSNHYFAEYGSYMAQTADAIFMPVEQQRYNVLLSIGSNSDNDISLGMNADGTASLRRRVYSGSIDIANGTITCFTTGKWHHIALTVDSGGNAVGYVNGYPVVSGTYTSVAVVGSRSGNMHFRCGTGGVTFRKFLTYECSTYNFLMTPKQVMQRAAEVGLGPKLEYDGLNAINVVNTEKNSEITIYESNVNDTSNLYVVSCNESSYLLSNAGTYYAQIKGTDTFTITRPLTVSDDHFPLYQYPPVVTGTTSGLTTSTTADTWNTWTISGAANGNGTYKAKTSQATNAPGGTHATIAGLFTNGIKNDTITEGGTTHYNMLQTSSATTCDLTLQLPSAKIIRKYVLYPTDTNAPTSPYEPGSSVDPTLPGNGGENSLRRPKSWVLKGSNDDANWTDLDTVTNQPPSIYGDVHSISSPASYQYYKLSVTANNGSTERLQLGEWQLWGDA